MSVYGKSGVTGNRPECIFDKSSDSSIMRSDKNLRVCGAGSRKRFCPIFLSEMPKQEKSMGLLDFFRKNADDPRKGDEGRKEDDAVKKAEIVPADEASLAKLESGAIEKRSVRMTGQLSGFVDALIPLALAGGDAANQYGMAVVKFPKGVGWNDLCTRRSDGWKLLSSFKKNGDFNKMAAIKQAGLSSPAVANLALQGAAVAVGAAYMAQISNQLKGIESGIEAIRRELQAERDAKILSSFDMLQRYSVRFEEYNADSDKRQAALIGIEQSLRDAKTMWHFQIDAMRSLESEVSSSKKAKPEEILGWSDKMHEAEGRSAAAFQLCSAVAQLSMRYDDDFSEVRIGRERSDLERMLGDYRDARGSAYRALVKKASKVKGAPLMPADAAENSYLGSNPLVNAAFEAGANIQRINPVRMRRAAKGVLEEKRNGLIDGITAEDPVKAVSERQIESLEDMDFMYNRANAMLLEDGKITFVDTHGNEDGAVDEKRGR